MLLAIPATPARLSSASSRPIIRGLYFATRLSLTESLARKLTRGLRGSHATRSTHVYLTEWRHSGTFYFTNTPIGTSCWSTLLRALSASRALRMWKLQPGRTVVGLCVSLIGRSRRETLILMRGSPQRSGGRGRVLVRMVRSRSHVRRTMRVEQHDGDRVTTMSWTE